MLFGDIDADFSLTYFYYILSLPIELTGVSHLFFGDHPIEFLKHVLTLFRALKQRAVSTIETDDISSVSTSLCTSERMFSKLFSFTELQRPKMDFILISTSFV
jgi:hypothetical protein